MSSASDEFDQNSTDINQYLSKDLIGVIHFIGPYASHESGGGAQKMKEPKHQLGTQVKKLKNADDQLTASAVDMHEL